VRVRRRALVLAVGLLSACTPAERHFPAERELTALLEARVRERRAGGIAVGVLEADGSTTQAFTVGLELLAPKVFEPSSHPRVGEEIRYDLRRTILQVLVFVVGHAGFSFSRSTHCKRPMRTMRKAFDLMWSLLVVPRPSLRP